ncbi:hypothetical protein [Streptomyces lanatus]|uniref:Uncharacterized protein n=1 Tax=Streptomyces lanatus TaxID=66900 RepID=A0ABV1XRI3_9ACTN|nr:hypothetical protein [Streptomyces lanatus]GHH04993.1 hypothetical protein GCM10018780_36020 [Streptomyces lanatus]
MPGTVLLLAASPVGKACLVDAASVLPILAAVPPAVLSGTDTANVVELADPLEPQAVLTRLRAAATAPGPLTVFVAGQIQLDRRQHLPHLALARSTPATVRYTGFPWHWFREELRLRAPGSTSLIVDLHADAETWEWLCANPLDSGRQSAVYGRIAPPPSRRTVAGPTYMKAIATLLRSGHRPPLDQLHHHALSRIAPEGGTGKDIVLTAGHVQGSMASPPRYTPGPPPAMTPPAPTPTPVMTPPAPGTPPGPMPAPAAAGPQGPAPASAPRLAPTSSPLPAQSSAPAAAASALSSRAPALVPSNPPTLVLAPLPGPAPTPAPSPASSPTPNPASSSTQSPTPAPPLSLPPAPAEFLTLNEPEPEPPTDPHDAITSAVQSGRHKDADELAAMEEHGAVQVYGAGSVQALHWSEVRADLAMLAGDPVRSCRTWLMIASARLTAGQAPDAAVVEDAVDRAHHQWGEIRDAEFARELGSTLAELRGKVPGRRPGALENVRQRLEQLQLSG